MNKNFSESLYRNLSYWTSLGGNYLPIELPNIKNAISFGLHFEQFQQMSISLLRDVYHLVGQFSSPLEWGQMLEGILDEITPNENEKFIYDLENMIGYYFFSGGNYKDALDHHTLVLSQVQEIGGRIRIETLVGLTQSSWGLGKYKNAKYYGDQALTILNQNDFSEQSLGNIYNILGLAFFGMEDYEAARIFFDQSVTQFMHERNKIGLARSYYNHAVLNIFLFNNKVALSYFGKAASLMKEHNLFLDLLELEIFRGILHYRSGQYNRAELALGRAHDYISQNELSDFHKGLSLLVKGYFSLLEDEHLLAYQNFMEASYSFKNENNIKLKELVLDGIKKAGK